MKMLYNKHMEYLYRYRSIKSLFKYKELDNLSIYFAKPDELNDQMEKYMNVVWQGDAIAFQGLFKHYLYTLTYLYFSAVVRNPKQDVDTNNLPIFFDIKVLEAPEMQDMFKDIYNKFFAFSGVAQFPNKMAASKKKFTIDEMVFVFRGLHLYAYTVIDIVIKSYFFGKNRANTLEEVYDMVTQWNGYNQILDILTSGKYSAEQIEKAQTDFVIQQQIYRELLNKDLYKDKNTHNISLLTFDFPEIYMRNITKLLYNGYCIACFSGTYQNEPMWAHYADSESGVCLQYKIRHHNGEKCLNLYSVSNIIVTEKEEKIEKNFHDVPVFRVLYSNEYPEIDFFTSLGVLPMPIIQNFWLCNYDKTEFSSCLSSYQPVERWIVEYHKKAINHICTKAQNWSYEQEYRIFQRDVFTPISENKENRLANYSITDLEAIIFGRNVSSEEKRKIANIIETHCHEKNHSVKFYDLYYSSITKKLELRNCLDVLTTN